jgi:hypothetical protein
MHDVPGVRSALEELITACLLVVKSHLTQIMYPFVENSGNPDASLEGIFTARPYLVGEAFGRTCRPGEAASSTALRAPAGREGGAAEGEQARAQRCNGDIGWDRHSGGVYCDRNLLSRQADMEKGNRGGSGGGKGKKEKETIVEKTLGMSALSGLRFDALWLLRRKYPDMIQGK